MRYILILALLSACTEAVCVDTNPILESGVYNGLTYRTVSTELGSSELTVWEESTVLVEDHTVYLTVQDCRIQVQVDTIGRIIHTDRIDCDMDEIQISGKVDRTWISIAFTGSAPEGAVSYMTMLNKEQ